MTKEDIIIFYDVDGTLAEPFQSPIYELKKMLTSLDKAGVEQVLCSGKGKDYLAGMARGLGIANTPYVIAENGGVIYDWKKQKIAHIADKNSKKVKVIKPKVLRAVKKHDYYEELKETIITLFFENELLAQKAAKIIEENIAQPNELNIKSHPDGAVDIIWGNIHKGIAIEYYMQKISSNKKIFTCGDGINDLEMLSIGYPVTFNNAHPRVKDKVKSRKGYISEEDGPVGLMHAISHLVFENHINNAINHISYIKRHWGSWEVLSVGKDYKVKEMRVAIGKSLSLQKHHHRSEHWFVFEGEAEVSINNKNIQLSEGEDYFIPQGSIHKVSNIGESELVIIEVQRGKYLGEDDIVRYNSDY